MSDINDQWKRFLTPDILRENLLSASIYIVAFEILKNTIIDRVKEAYTEFYEDKTQPGVKYKKEVLSKVTKKKSLAIVSLEWLITEQVINHQDLSEYNKIKNIRNSLVHEFPHIWEKGLPGKFLKLFQDIIDLL